MGRKKQNAAEQVKAPALSLADNHAEIVGVPAAIDRARSLFAPARSLGFASENDRLAQDTALASSGAYSLIAHALEMGQIGGQNTFLGYGILQNIAQNALIRACVEVVADDLTTNWIQLESPADEETDDLEVSAVKAPTYSKRDSVEEAFRLFNIKRLLNEAAAMDGYEGGAFLFIDTGAVGPKLAEPLNKTEKSAELTPGGKLRFVLIDPVNVAPGDYNSRDPLKPDYFKPEWWFVLGQRVHASRLIRIVSNEPLTLMRPAYNFMGVPQAQLIWDYVMHFQENRASANRLLNKFSLTCIKTSLQETLFQQGGTAQIDKRFALLARHRNNDGILAVDKDAEDVVQINTPLSGVREMVQQSLEHLAAVNRIPAVKLLGISPSGFNATGESDIRNYYDHIASKQEKILRPALEEIIKCVSLWLWGEPDAGIKFSFAPMSQEDEAAVAAAQNQRAASIAALVGSGVISPEEARHYLKNTKNSGFEFIDVDDTPDTDPAEGESLNLNLEDELNG